MTNFIILTNIPDIGYFQNTALKQSKQVQGVFYFKKRIALGLP